MTSERLNIERQILLEYLPAKQFRLTQDELLIAVQTNSLRVYTVKIDLTNDGEITEEMLANVTSIRVSMAKPCVDKDEPWSVTFADSTLK